MENFSKNIKKPIDNNGIICYNINEKIRGKLARQTKNKEIFAEKEVNAHGRVFYTVSLCAFFDRRNRRTKLMDPKVN